MDNETVRRKEQSMNTEKAIRRINELGAKAPLNEEEEFEYTELLSMMIEETKETRYMVELGGYYYEKRIFDKALKYYEMAYTYGDEWVAEGLGYIWYYGRTGETDYDKAFFYFSKSAEQGHLKSKIKVADMYKNGYAVEKNYPKYVEIIEQMQKEIGDPKTVGDPYSEVYTRLARIRKDEGRIDEAVELYHKARWFQEQRIRWTHFFGDRNIMKWMIEDLYTMIEFDPNDFGLYDLYFILKAPVTVTFRYLRKKYTVSVVETEEGNAIRFEKQWYRTIDDFFEKANIKGTLLVDLYKDVYGFEVIHGNH